MSSFAEFLAARLAAGRSNNDDALHVILPLIRQVLDTHEQSQVAPLDGLDALRVENDAAYFEDTRAQPVRRNRSAIDRIDPVRRHAIQVLASRERVSDLSEGTQQVRRLDIHDDAEQPVTAPAYVPGYRSWEQTLEHHDPNTDIFCLGMMLASLVTALDFHDRASLERFVTHRRNLFAIAPHVHPVLAKAIVRMTELSRHDRPQDLEALLLTLSNYKDQDVELAFDPASVDAAEASSPKDAQTLILSALQERLFEISRRNRLLHHRTTQQMLNLTEASVPVSLRLERVHADDLLTWNGSFRDDISAGRAVSLGSFIDFKEVLYAGPTLDRIRAESRRDRAEFGFEQLRLVVAFLRWTNLREDPPERYDSPLALLPVRLTRKKGVRDSWWLEPLDDVIEINPVVRHQFRQLYDITIPETIPLEAGALDALYAELNAAIQASEPGITFDRIDRPRIENIYDHARRRLDQYVRRAQIAGRGLRTYGDLKYSYDPANYHPLGLRLFNTRLRYPETRLHAIVSPPTTRPSAPGLDGAEAFDGRVSERRQQFYHMAGDSGNPYHWEFDLCRVTLGNMRYRKMTLVRDYAELLRGELRSPSFDALTDPSPRDERTLATTGLESMDRWDILPCDPTQSGAIAHARAGSSYIIQGPPGTGKSQTITNLIADAVARGQRVLFVCEKRAAIDVVFARLRQMGLDALSTIIHDSQADKKSFVMDLKSTYERFLDDDTSRSEAADDARREVIERFVEDALPVRQFHEAMVEAPDDCGVPIHELVDRTVELQAAGHGTIDLRESTPGVDGDLPDYAHWVESAVPVDRLRDVLRTIQPDEVLARHPLALLSGRILPETHPDEFASSRLGTMASALDSIIETCRDADIPDDCRSSVAALDGLTHLAGAARFFADHDRLGVLQPDSEEAAQFSGDLDAHDEYMAALDNARTRASNWTTPLPREELGIARSTAERLSNTTLPFLRPAWWRLRTVLRSSYDFSAHMVRPDWSHVIQSLTAVYDAEDSVAQSERILQDQYSIDEPVHAIRAALQRVDEARREVSDPVREWWDAAISDPTRRSAMGDIIAVLAEMRLQLDVLRSAADVALDAAYLEIEPGDLRRRVDRMENALDDLPEFLDCLRELEELPAPLARCFRSVDATPDALESAIAQRTLSGVLSRDRRVKRMTAGTRDRQADRLARHHGRWQRANADAILEVVCRRFLDHVEMSASSDAKDPDTREAARAYREGRRALEHEFGKVMRYRSIRDLVTGDSGQVVRDLKPIWLMSPLSVSDTLPLEDNWFDVVIFDEASQVTLEEAVPALFRAPQVIVVGDEMQLPPTNFFSSRSAEDDSILIEDDTASVVEYDLGANSFLRHAANHLPSGMLGWHYRSRSESLISFSNWTFYDGALLTVPDERVELIRRDPVEVTTHATDESAERGRRAVLDRAVSFHLMENGCYEQRRNTVEADYIARLVRELLNDDGGKTIGIVAFSEAQQGEIERALQSLARLDRAFAAKLDEAYEREEDGQFVGLLIKNLENIQGDERDIIILSVCYGPDPNGRMRMNFGPINQSGGSKRLNVAFSRSKHHMVVVSSIRGERITNEHNDGAYCLRQYLRFAETMSVGDVDAGRAILRDMAGRSASAASAVEDPPTAVAAAIAAALEDRGYLVDHSVGMSHFRCDLAVRRPGESRYRLGILLDGPRYYAQADLLERDVLKPRLLEAFGWSIRVVLSLDWHRDPESVLAALETAIAGALEAAAADDAVDADDAAAPDDPEADSPDLGEA